MIDIDNALYRLSFSKFRSSFKLSKKLKDYVNEKGLDVVKSHARDFIAKKLAPSYIENDGKQTPMKGHPVFIAQHACACCCRECLYKWYKIPKNIQLTKEEQENIVELLMAWIKFQI